MFKISIALITFFVIIVTSNLQVNAINIDRFQNSKITNLIQALVQAPNEEENERVEQTEETTPTKETDTIAEQEENEEEELKIEPLPNGIIPLLWAILAGSLAVIIIAFSPVFFTKKQGLYSEKADFIDTVLPRVVEGLTVILVVAVVTILSLVSRIDPEGAISLLSAVVGYVLGRSQSFMVEKAKRNKSDTTPSKKEDADLDTDATQTSDS